ncbi:Rieske 2Fe-2S domain-containing protein [Paracoccaceae bacterium GXU_MW_L88]
MRAWHEFPGAPAPGTAICEAGVAAPVSEILGKLPVLVVPTSAGPRAFVNLCPHQFLPLDQRDSDVQNGDRLICSNHDAVFDALTGEGLSGHAEGCRLAEIPLKEQDGQLVIA